MEKANNFFLRHMCTVREKPRRGGKRELIRRAGLSTNPSTSDKFTCPWPCSSGGSMNPSTPSTSGESTPSMYTSTGASRPVAATGEVGLAGTAAVAGVRGLRVGGGGQRLPTSAAGGTAAAGGSEGVPGGLPDSRDLLGLAETPDL